MHFHWLAVTGFALLGAITPGPVNVLALRHGMLGNLVAALCFVLGASGSYAAVVWLCGSFALRLLAQAWLVQAMHGASALYLLWLARKIATSPVVNVNAPTNAQFSRSLVAALSQGCLVQALNPKAWLVALSGVGLAVLPHPLWPWALEAFCAISLLACLVGVGTWACAGVVLVRWLETSQRQRRFNHVMGGMLALMVAVMFY